MKNPQNPVFSSMVDALAANTIAISIAGAQVRSGSHTEPEPLDTPNSSGVFSDLIDLALHVPAPLLLETWDDGSAHLYVLDERVPSNNSEIPFPGAETLETEIFAALGADIPSGHALAMVFEQEGGNSAIFNVMRMPAGSQPGGVVRSLVIFVHENTEAPNLDDCGVTQATRWLDGISRDVGLSVVTGARSSAILDTTALELSAQGARVIWVSQGHNVAALKAFDAEFYVFLQPMQTFTQISAIVELSKDCNVLACAHSHTGEDLMDMLEGAGIDEATMASVFNATLAQATAAHDGALGISAHDFDSRVLLSEVAVFDTVDEVHAFREGCLPYRSIVIDAAEKVRSGELPETNAYEVCGEELTVYL